MRDRQAAAVLAIVRASQGVTSAEVGAAGAYDRYVAARRLPELERLHLVKRGEPRTCAVTGRSALTWWAVSL